MGRLVGLLDRHLPHCRRRPRPRWLLPGWRQACPCALVDDLEGCCQLGGRDHLKGARDDLEGARDLRCRLVVQARHFVGCCAVQARRDLGRQVSFPSLSPARFQPAPLRGLALTALAPFDRPTTSVAATTTRPASSSQAATTSASAPDAAYTDYNSCMRAYNACLDSHQPKNGGAADFSSCYTMNCATLQTKKVRRSHRAASHRA